MLESMLIYLPLGIIAGLMAGLLGLGGGLVVVPILTITLKISGVPDEEIMKMALGTSFATICFTSLSSVYAHNKKQAVLWRVLFKFLPGVLCGVFVFGFFVTLFSTLVLKYCFAVFVLFSIYNLLRAKKKAEENKPPNESIKVLTGFGFGIGGISALVGVGGGAMTVPLLNHLGFEMKKAIGTSAAAGFPIALAGAINAIWHGINVEGLPAMSLGYIYLPALFGISITSMLFAPIGAKLAHTVSPIILKRVFVSYLGIIFIQMVLSAH
ncbi:sulfite exporter TauE/SafE family protein [Thorsellia kenyensis]|uniref:Probable membrane transporter protein n=1 Tax=Thorsellia kenyensis TaxID=1549888 RepID=A0ABV6CCU0_9GAMM